MNARRLKIKLAVVRVALVNDDAGFMTREDDLFNELLTFIRPAPALAEVADIVTECEREHLFVAVVEDDIKRISPTAAAKAWKMKREQA